MSYWIIIIKAELRKTIDFETVYLINLTDKEEVEKYFMSPKECYKKLKNEREWNLTTSGEEEIFVEQMRKFICFYFMLRLKKLFKKTKLLNKFYL